MLTELHQHRPQLEANLEALLHRGRAHRQRRENTQRLIEPDLGFPQCGSGGRLDSGPPEIGHRLLPHLATDRVMGKPLDLLAEAITIEALHGLRDPDVEVTAPAEEEAP